MVTAKKDSSNTRIAASVKVGSKGQVVIPRDIRKMFDIAPGDTLIMLADKKRGIAANKYENIADVFDTIMKAESLRNDEENEK